MQGRNRTNNKAVTTMRQNSSYSIKRLTTANLLTLSLLILVQKQPASANNSTATPLSITATTTTTTTTPSTATSISESQPVSASSEPTLLSGEEFVDFTEAPTLLFDNASNEETNNSSSSSSADNHTDSPTNQTTTTTTSTSSPTTLPATEAAPEETDKSDGSTESEPPNDADDAELDNGEGGDQLDGGKHPFEPPKNVSQYMDYIERLFHDLRHQITDLFEPHLPQLIRTSQMVQLSGSCSYDMLRMALALRQFEPWALRMIDSSGKVPEGIFEGSFTALGSYDECLSTVFGLSSAQSAASSAEDSQQQSASNPTQGKYCLVNVSPYLPPKPPADKVEGLFLEEADRRNYTHDDQFSRISPMFYYMKFRIGVCIPSTCQDSDMESISAALSTSLRLNITVPHCRVKQSQPFTKQQLIGGSIFALVLSLVFGATLLDCARRKLAQIEDKGLNLVALSAAHATVSPAAMKHGVGAGKDGVSGSFNHDGLPVMFASSAVLAPAAGSRGQSFASRLNRHWSWMSFSLLANFRLYFDRRSSMAAAKQSPPDHTTSSSAMIRCLNGIRVLSLCWVIAANSYITLDPRVTKRLSKTREAPKDFLFQMVAQASLAIETFFFLSGVLVSLSFARRLHANDAANDASLPGSRKWRLLKWFQFYLHRYIRMTPATMLVIAFTMFAFRFGDGPLWFEATHKAHLSCGENWWRHLLHVANFIDTRQMCFIHYWYIAADMQLFLFAPLLLFLIYKRRKIGYAIATLIGLLSIGFVFYTTYMRNLPPTLLFYNSDPESRREFGNTIMTKPLTHALPYLVGMFVGKWLSAPQSIASVRNYDNGRQNAINPLIGPLATVVALAEVFLPYKWNNSHLPTRFLAALYAALFRFAWSLVLAYLVVSCRHRPGKRCLKDDESADNNRRQCSSCASKASQGVPQTQTVRLLDGIPTKQFNRQDIEDLVWCYCGSDGSLINRFLSLNIFTHLSKLSFVAYLIHLPLMSVFVAQTRGLFAFSHTLVIHLALSYLLMTFILSFVLVHIIEFPFITFELYLFEKLFYSRSRQAAATSVGNKNDKSSEVSKNRDNCGDLKTHIENNPNLDHHRDLHLRQIHETKEENYMISQRL